MRKITIIPVLLLAFIMTNCSRSDKSLLNGKKQIALVIVDDSALRIDPIVTSARITVLSTGENAEVIDSSREKSAVAGKEDFWYKVRLRSGVSGWIWGQNIKIFAEGADNSAASYAKELRANEEERVRKELKGKWWSVTGEDTFTNHILTIRSDGTFASLVKGGDKPIEGTYTIDTEHTLVKLDKPAAFGDSVNYIIRGDFYVLEALGDRTKTRFKRISTDPNFKDELPSETPESGPVSKEQPKTQQ